MAQAQLIEEEVPAGGIADFIMTAEEIADLEKEEAKEAFGSAGIANFEDVAKRMASYGRYGDDKVAHVETGELLVPRALIEGNPELKESIFSHLREMGVENPERYVVGSGENSINPETGLPEFFFKSIRRAVSKIGKSVSKAVSKVGKVLKKVAPVVLPIVLGAGPLGAMYGAALGSGIGTLIQGGNLKDALKSALTAGAIGGITAGFTGKGSFLENVSNAAKDPLGRLSQAGSGISKAFETGSIREAFQSYKPPAQPSAAETLTELAPSETPVTTEATVEKALSPSTDPNIKAVDDPFFQNPDGSFDAEKYYEMGRRGALDGRLVDGKIIYDTSYIPSTEDLSAMAGPYKAQAGAMAKATPLVPAETARSGFVDSLKETGQNVLDFFDPRVPDTVPGLEAEVTRLKGLGYTDDVALKIAQENVAKATPGFIERYGPLAVAGTGAAALGGFFEAAPQEDPNLVDQRTGADLIAENPEGYRLSPEARTPSYAQGPFTVGTEYGLPSFLQRRNPFVRPQMFAADGGQVFPRRTGGIMPNEGVPDEDSVRALLMPGEFVMTKKAVKGLGNGSMKQGINNMYSMMRNLENKGQMMS